MPTVDIVNDKNDKTGQIDLPSVIFEGKVNNELLHEVNVLWLRNRRRGTASTKGRSDVSGGGHKPWRQKGTGRARVGTIRSPLWVGGGTVHGPKPKDFSVAIPKKKKKGALRSALSYQYRNGNITVFEGLALEQPKTAKVIETLQALGIGGDKVLIVVPRGDETFEKSARNITGVLVVSPEALNPYLVLYHQKIVIFKDALPRIEEVFG